MEDGSLTPDDGTTDVQRLLVEPQDEHVSMDSVLCFSEKIPVNAMKMEEVSCRFVGTNYSVAQEGGVVPKQEVIDVMPSEVEAGYFQLQNDFCSMGEDYFSGIEFAQSITNLDYGLSEGLHMSSSDSPIPGSNSDANKPWKSDLLEITDVTECQNDRVNFQNSELSDICTHQECETTSVEEKPLRFPMSSIIQNISELKNIPSHSPRDISSDEDGGSLFPSDFMSGESFFCSKIQKDKEFGLMGQNAESNSFNGHDGSTKISNPANTDALTTQKRSRKPTRRYIDELAEPISRHSKKRQEVSISAPIAKSPVVKNREKCHIESKTRISPEESSVIAIQVPFGSLVHKECQKSHSSDMVLSSDNENSVEDLDDICVAAVSQKKRCGYLNAACEKKRDDSVTAVNQKKADECVTAVSQKKRDDRVTAASQKKRDDCVTAASQRKREDHVTPVSQKKRDGCVTVVSQKKRSSRVSALSQKKKDDCVAAVSQKKRDSCDSATSQKKRDDCVTEVRQPEVRSRRKHHRLWTISEVRKLIDGVSQYGVGRWSRIKKLLFSTSPHRTSVDLKDKWRNLLKASGIQEQGNRQGEKKRNLAWRPLPKPILRRVCELATIYPYPNGRKPKIIHHVPPDRSADITLSDYRRILRSINGN